MLGEEPNRVVVPAPRPCRPASKGQYVYVVKADGAAEMRPVTVGAHRTTARRSSRAGSTAGETVVTDGQLRLVPGAKVTRPGRRGARRAAAMNLSGLFIRRPVMTTLVMVAILIFGVMAYRLLPVTDLPNVDFPTISVNASAARRQPGDHGLVGRDAAREAVLDHRRRRRR